MDLFFLDASDAGHAVHGDLGNPDRPSDGAVLSMQGLRRILLETDAAWAREIDRTPCPHPVTSWGFEVADGRAARPDSDSAAEVMRGFLVALHRSRYRPALDQSWNWRETGGAASRAMAVEIPRKAVSGGIVFPLLKQPGRKDIGMVLPIFDFGGVEKVAASLARELAAAGHRLHLFIASDRPIHSDAWALEPFATVSWLPDASTLDWSGPEYLGTAEPSWGNGTERADLAGLLSSMDAVINAHSAALHKVAGRLRQQGILMIDHEHLVERSTYGRNYGPPKLALAYEHAYDLVLTCSRTLAHWLNAQGMPRRKLCPLVNAPGYPLKADRLAKALDDRATRPGDGPLRVLFMGRLDPQKGVHRLSSIYHALALRAPRINLTIAGGSVVDAARAEFSFPRQTRMLGPVRGQEALTLLLADADVMVLPSHYEGLPLSVLEAQRCGVVVLATEVGAMEEAIQHGSTGFILPEAGCEDSFVDMILTLDSDRALLAQVSQNAARMARDWSLAVAPVLAWLKRREGPGSPGETGSEQPEGIQGRG